MQTAVFQSVPPHCTDAALQEQQALLVGRLRPVHADPEPEQLEDVQALH